MGGGSTRRLAGTARQVDGGWMVKGAWVFATGSAHASHAYFAVYLDETDDSNVGMILVPREHYTRLDDWDAMGLAGTGSATIVISDELFVPDEQFSSPQIPLERFGNLKREGEGLRPGGLIRSVMVGTRNALGMAEHGLELFLGSIEKKAIAYPPYARQQDAPVTRLNVGQVRMQINAARRLARIGRFHDGAPRRDRIVKRSRIWRVGRQAESTDSTRYAPHAAISAASAVPASPCPSTKPPPWRKMMS